MKFSELAATVKGKAMLIPGKISSGLGKVEFTRVLPRAKKEAALMRERIFSLRDLRLSFGDPKLFWVSGLLFVIFQGTISAMLWRVDGPWEIFVHQLSTSIDGFLVQRDNWGPAKVQLYLQHYWLDFLHPVVYAVFLRCLLTQVQLSFPSQYVFHSMAFPIAAAIYDEIENICQLALMAGWTENKVVFYAGALGAYSKWMLLTAVFAAIAHAVGKYYWEKQLEG